jgi:uncharacterized protein (TIGR03435 family)
MSDCGGSDTYDISARAEDNAAEPQMAGPMLRNLLEDRFKLKTHKEEREVSAYSLKVAKNGSKLEPMKAGSCTPVDPSHPPTPARAPGKPPTNYCGAMRVRRTGKTVTVTSYGSTMERFAAAVLTSFLDREVLDRSGLSG